MVTIGPIASIAARLSWKRTVPRRWSTQACGSVACSAVTKPPVRFDRYGIVGGDRSIEATIWRNSSRIGSSIELCAAATSFSRVAVTSLASSCAARSSITSAGPLTTHSSAVLMTDSDSPSGSRARTSSSGERYGEHAGVGATGPARSGGCGRRRATARPRRT